MHILFVHSNFPAQFGHVASYLMKTQGIKCSFVTEANVENSGGIKCIKYQTKGAATRSTHFCSRSFENATWAAYGVVEALAAQLDSLPDLVVAHSGFFHSIFLRELFACPIVNYFEYFYHTKNSDIDFRSDLPTHPWIFNLRARARNATVLLDLDNCDVGISPTVFQKSQIPRVYHDKVQVCFDGINTDVWSDAAPPLTEIGSLQIPADVPVLTYVSRGFESMRGFDIFMKAAKRICEARPNVQIIVVGEDRVAYSGDSVFTKNQTFKEWVLSQDTYDLSRIHFVGRLAPSKLAQLLARTDAHIYLTAPFVLSWSLVNAMSCGATVIASDTAPVREVIEHEKNGLLVNFFDGDGLVNTALKVLDDPKTFRPLGRAARQLVLEKYSYETCLPRLHQLYKDTILNTVPKTR